MKNTNKCLCCGTVPAQLYTCVDGRLYACCDLCARNCDLCRVRLQGAKEVEEATVAKLMKTISVCDLEQAREADMGWCTYCGDLTRGECEPAARDYPCPRCGNNTVYGCEEALMRGFIESND